MQEPAMGGGAETIHLCLGCRASLWECLVQHPPQNVAWTLLLQVVLNAGDLHPSLVTLGGWCALSVLFIISRGCLVA